MPGFTQSAEHQSRHPEHEDASTDFISGNLTADIPYHAINPPEAFGDLIKQRFSLGTDTARDRANAEAQEAEKRLSLYFGILRSCDDQACGACLVQGVDACHGPYHCPQLKDDLEVFRKLQAGISYKGFTTGPCYTCHIFTCGSNLLHKDMKAGVETCGKRDIMLPMLTVIWINQELRLRALEALGVQWPTLESFITWLSKPHPKHHTGPMAVLAHCAEARYLATIL